jgi:hypothetical protein
VYGVEVKTEYESCSSRTFMMDNLMFIKKYQQVVSRRYDMTDFIGMPL